MFVIRSIEGYGYWTGSGWLSVSPDSPEIQKYDCMEDLPDEVDGHHQNQYDDMSYGEDEYEGATVERRGGVW